MSNILALDDWAGNVITDYAPMVAAGVRVSINRLGQGDAYNNTGESGGTGDTLYKKHMEDAKKAGLLNATYWAISPELSWQKQIDWVIKNYNPANDDLDVFWIDDELINGCEPATIVSTVGNFVGAFEAYYHRKPGIYTARSWWMSYMRDANNLMPLWQSDLEFWLAQYPRKDLQNKQLSSWDALKAYYPTGWTAAIDPPRVGMKMKEVGLWQWSGGPILPGIKGAIDINWIRSDWLGKHTKGSTPEIPDDSTGEEDTNMIELTALVTGQNVRSGPSTSSTSIGSLVAGQKLTGLVDLKVINAMEVWAYFTSVGGWVALVHGSKMYVK